MHWELSNLMEKYSEGKYSEGKYSEGKYYFGLIGKFALLKRNYKYSSIFAPRKVLLGWDYLINEVGFRS